MMQYHKGWHLREAIKNMHPANKYLIVAGLGGIMGIGGFVLMLIFRCQQCWPGVLGFALFLIGCIMVMIGVIIAFGAK